jgi:hypothetical protein
MLPATTEIKTDDPQVQAYKHPTNGSGRPGNVWVVWAGPGEKETKVSVPVTRDVVRVIDVDGERNEVRSSDGFVEIELKRDKKISPPRIVVDGE